LLQAIVNRERRDPCEEETINNKQKKERDTNKIWWGEKNEWLRLCWVLMLLMPVNKSTRAHKQN